MRCSDHYLHGVVSSASLCGRNSDSMEEVVRAVAKEMCVEDFKPAQMNDLEKELLSIDEVHMRELIMALSPTTRRMNSLFSSVLCCT